jgi:membrane-bound inhibitor of C-type lysozyme
MSLSGQIRRRSVSTHRTPSTGYKQKDKLMLKTALSTLAAGFVLAAFAGGANAQDSAEQPLTKVSYLCQRNVDLDVVYINGLKNDDSAAVLSTEGKLVPMRISTSGSGALYVAIDEQDSYRWHTKGNEGTLIFLEADDSAKEMTVLQNCVAKEQAAE